MLRFWVVPVVLLASECAAAQDFEVASVKAVQLEDLKGHFKELEGGPGSKTPTRIAGLTTLMWMVSQAYGLKDQQVSGPSWMQTTYFEIAATVAPGATKEQEKVMWQNLLKERFHIQMHRETRELPLYALVVGKNGPKLKEADPAEEAADQEMAAGEVNQLSPKVTVGADGFPQISPDAKMHRSTMLSLMSGEFLRVKMLCRHETMGYLADAISYFTKRLVEDQTGLKGKYDFTLAFEAGPETATTLDGQASAPAERGASLPKAVQDQLGLKLEAKKGDIEMLVIERVEKVPTEN